jgi:ParB family chromosome partitioning protein
MSQRPVVDTASRQHPIVHHVVRVPVASVGVSDARRATLKEGVIEMLCASVARRGLLSPIRLRSSLELVCGLHRLVVHERLGRPEIDAIICDGDDVEIELDELEENLARKELTVLERARDERRRRDLYLLLHPQTRRGVAGATARRADKEQAKHVSFAETVALPGSGARMVQQRIQVAEALGDETAALLSGTPLANNHRQLVELARLPNSLRHDVARVVVENPTATVATAARALTQQTTTKEPDPKPRTSGEAEGLLFNGPDGLCGLVVVRGRRLAVTVEGATFRVRDEGASTERPRHPQDLRTLTRDNSFEVVAAVLDELPADMAPCVSVSSLKEDTRRACECCGGAVFWRSLGEARACTACQANPKGYRDPSRCRVEHPRLHQTIVVSSATGAERPRREEIHLAWWKASDVFTSHAYRDKDLVEVIGGDSHRTLVIDDNGLPPRVEDLKITLRECLRYAMRRVHRLREFKGKLFRDDGTEVVLYPRGHVEQQDE